VGTAIKFADDNAQSQRLTVAIMRNLRKLPDGRNKTKWEKLISDAQGPPHTPTTSAHTADSDIFDSIVTNNVPFGNIGNSPYYSLYTPFYNGQ